MSTSINIKKQIAAYEEGSQISSDISGIDITGDGASASMVGSKMVVNIPGGMGNITYYLNQTVTQAPYKEFSSIPTGAAEQTIVTSIASGATATIQSFQTASGVPGTTNIPGGLWSFYLHFSGTATDTWDVFVEVYKRDLGGIETLLLTTDVISTSTLSGTPTMILTDGVFPTSTVLTTDRIVVKVRVTNTDSTTNSITFHTEGSTNYSVATTTLNQTVPSGAVTSVSGAAPISSSGGTTPTISITQATALVDGYLDSADFATFSAKQDPVTLTTTGTTGAATFIANILNIPQYQGSLTLTTTGSSGSSTLIANTLNIPTYTLTGLGGVPSTRTITINGTTFDLSADRTWNVGTVTSVTGTAPIVSSGGTTPAISIPQATALANGYLSSTDWNTFNNKVDDNIYTADGTLGGNRTVTMSGNTLNFSGGNVGVNVTPSVPLHVMGTAIPSTNENLAYFQVTDGAGAYFAISNGSTADGSFQPKIFGRQASSSNSVAVTYAGVIDSTQDSGTTPVVGFQAHLHTLAAVVTRPLFQFRNWATNIMTILANGNVGIGTITPGEKLEVSGKTKTTTFQMTTSPIAGYVLTSDASGNGSWSAPASGTNIYNTDGTLTADRTLTGAGFNLTFDGLNTHTENINPSSGPNGYIINVSTSSMSGSVGSRIYKIVDSTAGIERLGITRLGNVKINDTYILPTTDGTVGQVLTTDGGGIVSWATPAAGSSTWNVTTQAGASSTAASNDYVLINAATHIVTLPTAANGIRVGVKMINATVTSIQIKTPSAGITIDGVDRSVTGLSIFNQYDAYTFVSDGTNWFIMG